MEEVLLINGMPYQLSYDQPITPEQRTQTVNQIRQSLGCKTCGSSIVSLAPSCPTLKHPGDAVGLGAAPMGGVSPYTVTFYKKVGTNSQVQIGTQSGITNAPSPTTNMVTNPSISYTITDADVSGSIGDLSASPPLAAGHIRIITTVVDSCRGYGGPASCTEICDISLSCVSSTCNAIIT